jgi:hypothetical protein
MANSVRALPAPLDDERRRQLVYGGELLVFEDVEPVAKLCAFADVLIRETLGTQDPVRASSR